MPAPKTAATKHKPAAPRKKAVIAPPNPELKTPPTEEERKNQLQAYMALKVAGIAIPPELAIVDEWIANEQARREIEAAERTKYQVELDEENAKGPWYVRNGYTAPFSIRLDRQTEKRRIELKARGVPGDMHPLQPEDLNDPVLKRNCLIGVCEIIPAGEANRILEHQTTNPGLRVHTPTAILRRADGLPYEGDPVKMEIEYNAQGITVGAVNPDQMTGVIPDKSVARDGGVTRVQAGQQEIASQFIPTGGNPAIIQSGPADENARLKIADDLARRKGVQGLQGGLSGMQVTVNPVVKS